MNIIVSLLSLKVKECQSDGRCSRGTSQCQKPSCFDIVHLIHFNVGKYTTSGQLKYD